MSRHSRFLVLSFALALLAAQSIAAADPPAPPASRPVRRGSAIDVSANVLFYHSLQTGDESVYGGAGLGWSYQFLNWLSAGVWTSLSWGGQNALHIFGGGQRVGEPLFDTYSAVGLKLILGNRVDGFALSLEGALLYSSDGLVALAPSYGPFSGNSFGGPLLRLGLHWKGWYLSFSPFYLLFHEGFPVSIYEEFGRSFYLGK